MIPMPGSFLSFTLGVTSHYFATEIDERQKTSSKYGSLYSFLMRVEMLFRRSVFELLILSSWSVLPFLNCGIVAAALMVARRLRPTHPDWPACSRLY